MDFLYKISKPIDTWIKAKFPEFPSKIPAFVERTRLTKPIGITLLLGPTIAALWIAAEGFPDFDLLIAESQLKPVYFQNDGIIISLPAK